MTTATKAPMTKKQKVANAISVGGGIAGIIALILVLLFLPRMGAQTAQLTGQPGQTGATGPPGPAGPAGPAGANGTDAYNVTYYKTVYVYNNQTFTILCTILKSQLNSSGNQTLTCTVLTEPVLSVQQNGHSKH